MQGVCKPIFMKLANSTVHKIFGIETWGVGLLTISILEKDDDLVAFIGNNMVAYAKEICVTWDLKHEKHGPSKVRQKKEM